MARSTRHDWFSLRSTALHRPGRQPFHRRLRIEPLEDRRLLAVVTVNTLNDTVDLNDGVTSLREAIFAANTVAGADTIEFAASLTSGGPATAVLTQGELAITDSLAINGPGANLLTIDASGNDPTPDENNGDGSRFFNIDDGNSENLLNLSISGLTLTGGDVKGDGGAILTRENLSVTGSTISGNSASSSSFTYGGGIRSILGTLIVTNSTISGNSAGGSGSGGGIRTSGGLTVSGSTITGNSSGGDAGGILGGSITVTDSTISDNSAGGDAGGIKVSGALTVTGSTISGNSANGTGSKGDGGGIYISSGSASSLKTITSSTISGNSANRRGGGIWAQGALTVTGSTISGNSANREGGGGIFRYGGSGNLTVSGSTISGNSASGSSSDGGGIYIRSGNLTVIGTKISGNSAVSDGGGIYNRYTTTVTGSTISGNSAQAGGGISSSGTLVVTDSLLQGNTAGVGGGIRQFNGSLTVGNSTITGNTAAGNGGGLNLFTSGISEFAVRHSTIASNTASEFGGGISVFGGRLNLDHTIVAQNSAALGRDLMPLIGAVIDARFNLIGDNANSGLVEAPIGSPDANGNLIGGAVHGVINPQLGLLGSNGGLTMTHALLVGSPAINAGDPSAVAGAGTVPEFDQRGTPFVRVFGGRIDIGAYERQTVPGLSLIVDTLVDESDADYSVGDLSLREAIELANGNVGGDTVTFALSLTSGGPATIMLAHGELKISDAMAIDGPGASLLTIDASGNDATPELNNRDGSRVLNIDDGNYFVSVIDVSISGLTLTGGDVAAGGAISTSANLTVTDSTISGNSASSSGGGIYSFGVSFGHTNTITIISSTISGNGGGGITSRDGTVIVIDSLITGNSTTSSGGGIFGYRSNVTVTRSTISGNSAGVFGGGISASSGSSNATVIVTDSTISGNSSGVDGGGISTSTVRNLTLTVTNSTISDNSAGRDGGGIDVSASTLTVTNSTISGNSAGGFGGGIYGRGTVTNSIVAGNTSGVAQTPNDVTFSVALAFSLLGVDTGATITDNGGNLIGTAAAPIDPLLGPLANNGGPTMTHALLPGSPAIDRGSGGSGFDQRGAPFSRVVDGNGDGVAQSDIGAFELQPMPSAFFGDYNGNGSVDAADYVVWRKTLGGNVAPFSDADGNGNGIVDQGDHGVWRAHFGQTIGAGSGATLAALSNGTSAWPPSASLEGELVKVTPMDRDAGGQTTSAYVPIAPAVMALATPATTHQLVAARSAAETVTARRDDALVAWLTAQRAPAEPFDDLDAIQPREHDGPSRTDGVTIDFVDECFALLAND